MQPYYSITFTRPWHWGIAIVGDSAADLPDLAEGQAASVSRGVAVLAVRHAQDIDAEKFEGDWNWATATFHIRSLGQSESATRQVVCDFDVLTPNESLSLGDADQWLELATPGVETRVIVTAETPLQAGLTEIWIDLVPARE